MKTLNQYGLIFHHLGLAVRKPKPAAKFLAGLGYTIPDVVRDDLQNVNLMLCTGPGMPAVEIIYPTETPGPLAPILKSQATVIYHMCFETQNLEKSMAALEADNRVFLVSAPQPAVLFGGRKVSFYIVAGFGVIEILEPK
jgi:methylmalonyl-CoA/ethylmalonyl-CoA epimerase